MRLVILESPYAGGTAVNVAYARACMRDCLLRGEAPYASRLLYTQDGVLDDTIPAERAAGMTAGFMWHKVADASVVYTDRGVSAGMKAGIENALRAGIPVEYRSLSHWMEPPAGQPVHWDAYQSFCAGLDNAPSYIAWLSARARQLPEPWMAANLDV